MNKKKGIPAMLYKNKIPAMLNYIKRIVVFLVIIAAAPLIYLIYWNINVESLNIIYTSDGHGNILPSVAFWEEGNPKIGGLSALGGFLSGIAAPYLLTDSGDIFQGTPEGVLTEGKIVIELMNVLGYDAVAVGNHDFDFGRKMLRNLTKIADFPFLAANMLEEDTLSVPGYLKDYTIKTINGIGVGIIGVITDEMPKLTFEKHINGLVFEDPTRIVNELAQKLREEGARIIVLLSHLGLDNDKDLAHNLKGVDVILGGHTHRRLYQPLKINRTLICQPGSKFINAGYLKLYYDSVFGIVLSYLNELVPLYVEKYPKDDVVESILSEGLKGVSEKLDVLIGESKVHLSNRLSGKGKKHRELALGNWQTDLMRKTLESDFAFQNLGGIRSPIPKGEISVRDIWKLSPFGNTLVKMTLSGSQIKELLEQSVAHKYSTLQVAGLKVIYNSSLPEGKRVLNIIVPDEEGKDSQLLMNSTYTVVTNSFLAQGGDGYSVFKEATDKKDNLLLLRDLQIDYIKQKLLPLYSEIEGRLMNVSIK